MRTVRLLLVGPPGAGKGTQARRRASKTGSPHVASGDILREAIASGTDTGAQARRYMDRGDLVPDELVIQIIQERLSRPDGETFVLDGFPRTEKQAVALDQILDGLGRPLDAVVRLVVDDSVIVERLTGRRTCPSCQRAYHLVYDPPATDEVCDDDGAKLVTRPDDAADRVRHRLDVYRQTSEGLFRHYDELGLLSTVDGLGSQDDVGSRVDAALEDVR